MLNSQIKSQNPRIRSITTRIRKKYRKPGGEDRPGKPGEATTPGERTAGYHSAAVVPDTCLNCTKKLTICVFGCWLTCHVASFEALLSLRKNKSTIHVVFTASLQALKKRYPSKVRDDFYVFPCHIGQPRPVKSFFVVTEQCIFGGQNKATTHIPSSHRWHTHYRAGTRQIDTRFLRISMSD